MRLLAVVGVCLVLSFVVAAEEAETLSQILGDVNKADGGAEFTAPLKAKLFSLQKRLEKELEGLNKRKDDLAQSIATAKLQLENSLKVNEAARNQVDRYTPAKAEADYNVLLARASLEVVIRAAKRQIKLNNLERDGLYAEIKFAEQAQVLRSRVVGENPPVALVSVEDLESELSPAARSVLEKKESVLSADIKKGLEELLQECRARLADLQSQDDANSAEIKRLQSALKSAVSVQTGATKEWKTAKDDFSKSASTLAKFQGMYNEMAKIAARDGAALESKIATVKKEISLVGTMVTKIEAYKPERE